MGHPRRRGRTGPVDPPRWANWLTSVTIVGAHCFEHDLELKSPVGHASSSHETTKEQHNIKNKSWEAKGTRETGLQLQRDTTIMRSVSSERGRNAAPRRGLSEDTLLMCPWCP